MSVQEIHLNQIVWKNIMPTVHAVYGDTGRELKMILDDITIVSGMTGDITFERSDGTYYSTTCTGDTTTNSFTGNITQGLTQVGNTKAQLRVTQNSTTTSTYTFIIVVHESNAGEITPQEGGSVLDALEKAEQAVETAEQAVEISEAAMEEAEDAHDFVQGIVSELATSIKSEALSGDIVTFDNGADNWPVNECVISVDAVQDLHGYDNPWPAGGGKNLLPPGTTGTNHQRTFTVNSDGTVTVTGNGDNSSAEFDMPVPSSLYGKSVILNGCPTGGNNSTTYRIFFLVDGSRVATDVGSGVSYTIPESPTTCIVRINVFPGGESDEGREEFNQKRSNWRLVWGDSWRFVGCKCGRFIYVEWNSHK